MTPRSKLGVFLCCLAPLSFADATKDPAWLQDIADVANVADFASCRGTSNEAPRLAGLGPKVQEGFEGWVSLMVLDYKLVNRSFYIQVPTGLNDRPAPLLIALHAQGFEADSYAKAHDFGTFGQSLGFVSIYPQGLDDALPGGADLGTGWNVGTAGDNQTCIGDEVMADCYESCWEQNRCGRCNWSGCYDERLFIFSVIEAVSAVLCIDHSRVYVTGESNGGMLAHYLVQSLPGTFAAVAPWFGLPLLGYGLGAQFELVRYTKDSRQTAMLQLHGRDDDVMPIAGGVAGNKWIYEPLNKVQQGWAAVHDCDTTASTTKTYWDGGSGNFSCLEFKGCSSGRRIMRCFYDGGHMDLPEDGIADQITLWFLLQYRLDDPWASEDVRALLV
ncbi:unnamed protein product [Cladocopium goreaui]|uniref:Peptidyl-prolyl cis-trans isomerase A n=1 Tax=Cladocopium goreaui TaxID=2562237 RepID=A0A9P1D3D4_9DINO|nr:unnamed protein product [Cladocopium goreaui]|mmetsp:Transcript_70816/g.143390  ORF Transcript_70816/g.143390 Transcript_70816/m.143390 type:complete len:387 (+) Transcript_70816:34-1194(+)